MVVFVGVIVVVVVRNACATENTYTPARLEALFKLFAFLIEAGKMISRISY